MSVIGVLQKYKILIVSILAGFFIYFRTLDYYKSIPRQNVLASIMVVVWTFLTLNEPLLLVLGLIILSLFGYHEEITKLYAQK
jgi:hypothetical protein